MRIDTVILAKQHSHIIQRIFRGVQMRLPLIIKFSDPRECIAHAFEHHYQFDIEVTDRRELINEIIEDADDLDYMIEYEEGSEYVHQHAKKNKNNHPEDFITWKAGLYEI